MTIHVKTDNLRVMQILTLAILQQFSRYVGRKINGTAALLTNNTEKDPLIFHYFVNKLAH